MNLFRIIRDRNTSLKKWQVILAALSTLIIVFLLSYIDRLLFLFFLAPWIPLALILIDAVLLLYRKQLVPVGVIFIWLVSLTLLGPLGLLLSTPESFYHLHNYVYLIAFVGHDEI